MTEQEPGFTLIELMVVVTLIAILASVAVPVIKTARIRANEAAAIQHLRNLATQQAQLRASQAIDSDRNGFGEYGFFQELSGVRRLRAGAVASGEGSVALTPPMLSGAFGRLDANGRVLRSGYLFQVFLPGAGGSWLAERSLSSPYPPVVAEWAEHCWAAFAWPGQYVQSGNTVFFVNQAGEVLHAANTVTQYSGAGSPPPATAALLGNAAKRSSMHHSLAVNATGTDGNFWKATK